MMRISLTLVCVSIVFLLSACGSDGGGVSVSGNPKDPPVQATEAAQPVSLSVFTQVPITDDDFQLLFAQSTKAKYPNISMKLIRPGNGSQIEDLIAAGNTPDLIISWNLGIGQFYEDDLKFDLTPLIKSNRFDVGRFDKTVLNTVSDAKGIYAIPFAVQLYALYYNKDIFDKFAVAYPRDGMTWDDTIELARKVTRTEDGTAYRGLDTGDINRVKLTKSLAIVDARTGRANVNNDQWKQAFQMLHQIYSIPGNAPGKFAPQKDFIENKVIAMWPAWNILDQLSALPPGSLNWDMAQHPSFKETPNTYSAVDTHVVFITKTSKNKEAAFKVIQTLTSDEIQLLSAKETGRLTPLVNQEIRDALAELPVLKGKNIQGVLKSHPAPAPNYTRYEQGTQKILVQAFKDYFDNGKDLNTVLRETDEEVNKYIEDNQR